jgi:signal transduction histidine kinase
MAAFFQQVFALLNTNAGNLTYHLVLAFSIAGALQAAYIFWRSSMSPRGRRMVYGLGLLLILQLVLYVSSGLAWQGLLDATVFLPLIDRAVGLVSLLTIIWLWVFPERSTGTADVATLLLGILTIVLLTVGILWWAGQSNGATFNGSVPDTVAEMYAILLAGIGLMLLLIRRPLQWGAGVAMLAFILAGHTAQLLLPIDEGSIPAAVRLAQMAAYPILLFLPQRFPLWVATPPELPQTAAPQPAAPASMPADQLVSILRLAEDADDNLQCRSIVQLVASAMNAEVCLLVSAPDPQGMMTVRCGYDLIREEFLAVGSLETKQVPVIVSAMRRTQSLRLAAESTSPDLVGLAQALGIERSGHLLVAPIAPEEGQALAGLILLTCYTNRPWTSEDQAAMDGISAALVHLLQHKQKVNDLQTDLTRTRQIVQESQVQVQQARSERDQLLTEISRARQSSGLEQSQLQSLAAVVAVQKEMQDQVTQLQAENEQLRGLLQGADLPDQASLQAAAGKDSRLAGSKDKDVEGELRMALEEIALLQNSLDEANQKIVALSASVRTQARQPSAQEPSLAAPESADFDEVAAIAQELRRPMSSAIGYTDFLLGESVGILGALQRKFLERLRVSIDRMSKLVEDLVRITHVENDAAVVLAGQAVEVSAAIDEAVSVTATQLREKRIALRVDLPEQLPSLIADRDALQQVLIQLLQNAGAATHTNGSVFLRARIENGDGEQDYVLIQVTDEGGGISPDDMPHVFSQIYRANSPKIQGLGNSTIEMSVVRTLVEGLGGRIWVDSEPGRGSTFSVVLPIHFSIPVASGQHEELA